MTHHIIKSDALFKSYPKNTILGYFPKSKMFVPLFEGLYESLFGFSVLRLLKLSEYNRFKVIATSFYFLITY